MQRRVHKAVEARTFAVMLGWPLSVARTVVIVSVFVLALCHTAVHSPSACPARGDNAAKENFAYVLESKGLVVQPVERLLSTVRMLATAIRFVWRKRTLQTQNRYIVTSAGAIRVHDESCRCSIHCRTFTRMWRRGSQPWTFRNDSNRGQRSRAKRGHRRPNQSTLRPARRPVSVCPLPFGNDPGPQSSCHTTRISNPSSHHEQGNIIDERLQSVEVKIEHRLQQVEEEEARLASDVEELHTQYQAVRSRRPRQQV